MTAPIHPAAFGRRAVSVGELRARAARRAGNLQAFRDLALMVALPLLIGCTLIGL